MVGMKKNGFTLVEMVIVLLIVGILAIAATRAAVSTASDNKARAIADQMKTITGGVGTMLSANFEALAASSSVAGFVNPLSPTIAELRTAGYLANNVQNSNLAGTGWAVRIQRVPAGCVAPTCDLSALVYSSAGFLQKTGNPDTVLANKVSQNIGNDGGVSRDSAPDTISGPNGLWTTTNPLGAVQAVVAMQTGFGSQGLAQFVRQGDSRNIVFGGALNVNGTATMANAVITGTAAVGGVCTPNGKVAQDGTGLLLSCQSGVWASQAPYRFGGSYISNNGTSCLVSNPYTGACSCPAGYNEVLIGNLGWVSGSQYWSFNCYGP